MNPAIDFSFRVTDGASEKFALLDDAIRKHMRVALAAIGKQIRDAARGLAPRKTGGLAKSIRASYLERGDSLRERVKPTKFYGKFLEYGVVNHGTQSNKAIGVGLRKTVKRAKAQRVAELRAQGRFRIDPRPFMRPALHSLLTQARAAVSNALADAVLEVDEGK